MENVPGLLSLFGGRLRDMLLDKFSSSPLGYNVVYEIITASQHGVPQHRRRACFVGLKKGVFEFPEATHAAGRNGSDGKTKRMITCEEAICDLPPLTRQLGKPVQRYTRKVRNSYQKRMRSRSRDICNHIAANHTKRVRKIISLVPAGCNYKSLPESLRKTRNFHVAWTRFPKTEPAPTIDTGHRHHFHYAENRVPTVRECARLQSFPDRFHFFGNKSEQFRQVGNAVPPVLAEALANKLRQYL
jgi:DNA (cytosine-5)-methyltransferase 1